MLLIKRLNIQAVILRLTAHSLEIRDGSSCLTKTNAHLTKLWSSNMGLFVKHNNCYPTAQTGRLLVLPPQTPTS